MSKTVNILQVLEKAHQSKAQMSKRAKQQIIDSYGRALTLKKVIDDFIKVNRELVLDMGVSENANLLHGKDYSLHVSQNYLQRLIRNSLKKNLANLRIINAKSQRNINKYKQWRSMRDKSTKIKSTQLKKSATSD